jgi:hypothetical protein
LVACETKSTPSPTASDLDTGSADVPAKTETAAESTVAEASPDGTVAGGTAGKGGKILSVLFGLDNVLGCGNDPAVLDGAPVVFDAEIDNPTIEVGDILVHIAGGGTATPACATLLPAGDEDEDRTLLLIGQFGTARTSGMTTGYMEKVEIVGDLCREGTPAEGSTCDEQSTRNYRGAIFELPKDWTYEGGASLPFAEFYAAGPGDEGDDKCPKTAGTRIRLVFSGGTTKPFACNTANAGCACGTIFVDAYGCDVTGDTLVTDPDWNNGGKACTCSGAGAADCQMVTALDAGGKSYHPVAFADLFDGDNNFELCFTETFTPKTVEVAEKFGYDPAPTRDPNEACRLDAHYLTKQVLTVK